MDFEPTKLLTNVNELNVDAFATWMKKILQNQMLLAQADYEKYANYHRGIAPQYQKSDFV